MNSKEILWRLLISQGNILTKRSYYGNDHDSERTRSVKMDLKKYYDSINFNKTQTPLEELNEYFQGTFTGSEQVNELVGVAVLRNGKKDKWYFDLSDTGDGLASLIDILVDYVRDDWNERG